MTGPDHRDHGVPVELINPLLGWHPFVLVQLKPKPDTEDDYLVDISFGGGIEREDVIDFLSDALDVLREEVA